MTSEVLILNKHAVVLAADSAITLGPTADGGHPRYAKTATKLFELSGDGNMAVTIFGGSHIDLVPWELVIHLFRSHLGRRRFPSFEKYLAELLGFVRANAGLFPPEVLDRVTAARFRLAVKHTLSVAFSLDGSAFDASRSVTSRRHAWKAVAERIALDLAVEPVHASLSASAQAHMLASSSERMARLHPELTAASELAGVDTIELADLAVRMLFARPRDFLSFTGIVVAGFGEQDIFPGFKSVEICGHVGSELIVMDDKQFQVTHTSPSHIEALAQTTMIDVFTDGFGEPLWQLIERENRESLAALVSALEACGVAIPPHIVQASTTSVHADFMMRWTQENYRRNWIPLKSMLRTLSDLMEPHLNPHYAARLQRQIGA